MVHCREVLGLGSDVEEFGYDLCLSQQLPERRGQFVLEGPGGMEMLERWTWEQLIGGTCNMHVHVCTSIQVICMYK